MLNWKSKMIGIVFATFFHVCDGIIFVYASLDLSDFYYTNLEPKRRSTNGSLDKRREDRIEWWKSKVIHGRFSNELSNANVDKDMFCENLRKRATCSANADPQQIEEVSSASSWILWPVSPMYSKPIES